MIDLIDDIQRIFLVKRRFMKGALDNVIALTEGIAVIASVT